MKSLYRLIPVSLFSLTLGCSELSNSPTTSGNSSDDTISKSAALYNPGDLDAITISPFTLLDQRFDVFVVRLVWGNLEGAISDADSRTDWSGQLSVNGEAAIWPKRLIDFEPDQDMLIPRDAFHTLKWKSITNGDFDGLVVEVYLRTDVVYITAPVLTFETEPHTVSFNFEQLSHLDTVIRVDDHNSLAVRAEQVKREKCPHGPLAGEWNFTLPGEGKFSGGIFARNDARIGRLAGRFWTTEDGRRLFAGKWQTVHDLFGGEVNGKWEFDPSDESCADCRNHSGRFKGIFSDEMGNALGSLHGVFGPADHVSITNVDKAVLFKGAWGVDCDRLSAQE